MNGQEYREQSYNSEIIWEGRSIRLSYKPSGLHETNGSEYAIVNHAKKTIIDRDSRRAQ